MCFLLRLNKIVFTIHFSNWLLRITFSFVVVFIQILYKPFDKLYTVTDFIFNYVPFFVTASCVFIVFFHSIKHYFGMVFNIFTCKFNKFLALFYFNALKDFTWNTAIVFYQINDKLTENMVFFSNSRQKMFILKLLK